MRSLGIDPSVTSTGLVVLEHNPDSKSPDVLFEKAVGYKIQGLQRCSAIAGHMLSVLEEYKPDRVVVEGYGYSNKHSLATLVELGTILRYFLLQMKFGYMEPSPNQLKKFVIGKGVGKKSVVMLHVYKRWGYETDCEDLADAYGLACIGLAHMGKLKGLTQPMLEVVGAVQPVK